MNIFARQLSSSSIDAMYLSARAVMLYTLPRVQGRCTPIAAELTHAATVVPYGRASAGARGSTSS